jgi:CheY-like chemotaxis protein
VAERASPSERRILLRAELEFGGVTVVARTRWLSSQSVFVETRERVPVGATGTAMLSFPTIAPEVRCRARVLEHVGSAAPGEPDGMLLELAAESEAERAGIEHLLSEADVRATGPRRVLVVEDNPLIRDMYEYGVRRHFEAQGSTVEVQHANDGRDALLALRAARYDLVIVDYYLPVLDGAGFIAAVRKDPALRTLPVIAISVGGEVAREATLDAGADLFVDKPLVLRDLCALLSKLTPREETTA